MATDDPTPIDDPWIIEAELHVPGMTVQVGSYDWAQTAETTQSVSEYILSMLMSPRHRFSQGVYDTEGGDGAYVDIGDMLLVPAGIPLRSRTSGGPIRFVRCCYEATRFEALTGLGDLLTPDILKHCLDIRDARLHEAMMRLAHEVLAPGFNVEALAEGLGIAIAIDLARHIRAIDPEPEMIAGGLAPWQLRRAQEMFRSENLSLNRVAQACKLSVSHFARAFKGSTGIPPHQWVMTTRIEMARGLLTNSAAPLAEIAGMCGFADQSHFNRHFKRIWRVTPSRYLRMVA